jgi:hypothetical protein
MTRVTLLYFDDCPNWRTTQADLQRLAVEGLDLEVQLQQVETHEQAVQLGFMGSPSILVDGVDPFAVEGSSPGLSCRVYPSAAGLRGSPTLDDLRAVLDR